jgi:hypothetical protein
VDLSDVSYNAKEVAPTSKQDAAYRRQRLRLRNYAYHDAREVMDVRALACGMCVECFGVDFADGGKG